MSCHICGRNLTRRETAEICADQSRQAALGEPPDPPMCDACAGPQEEEVAMDRQSAAGGTMSCHICVTTPADAEYMIKCKLCCDGLEQDACRTCSELYARYKRDFGSPQSKEAFRALQARRAGGIAGEALCNGYGDLRDPNAQYAWQFIACPGCSACRHLPRCNHCTKTARNGRGECGDHILERKAQERKAHEDRIATTRSQYRYFLEAGDLGIEYADEGAWRSYNVGEVCANTLKEFFDAVHVEEIDQDGGELDCYGFSDASYEIQRAICAAAAIDWKDAVAFEISEDWSERMRILDLMGKRGGK
jgi:hypothetical protein